MIEKPYASTGPRRHAADKANVAWADKLARVLREKPDGVWIFVRSSTGSVTVQVLDGEPNDDARGLDLDAMSIVIPGADCGDP